MNYPTIEVPKGSVVRSEFHVRSLGVFVDPTTVTCQYALTSSPGSPTSLTVTKLATGRYVADLDTTSLAAGEYTLKWKGVGAAIAVRERRITITAPTIA